MILLFLAEGFILTNDDFLGSYEYVLPNATNALGVKQGINVINNGIAKVYIYGPVAKDGLVRSRLSGDAGRNGMAFQVTSANTSGYLKIGKALESGRDKLIDVSLDIRYMESAAITGEIDPVFTAHAAYGITSTLISHWNTAYGWGNHPEVNYRAITSATTITGADYAIEITSGTFTQPLPTAVGMSPRLLSFKNSGTGVITITANGAQTIDGETSQTLYQGESMDLRSNNANWIIAS